jgi:hypothetical protein
LGLPRKLTAIDHGRALWDLRGAGTVHRFDKLSNGGNYGAFHPNGHDVMIDSTVWDIRTHNLRCMTGVDQCVVRFNAHGDVIYAYRPVPGDDMELGRKRPRDFSAVHVLDAKDYRCFHLHDTERQIMVRVLFLFFSLSPLVYLFIYLYLLCLPYGLPHRPFVTLCAVRT